MVWWPEDKESDLSVIHEGYVEIINWWIGIPLLFGTLNTCSFEQSRYGSLMIQFQQGRKYGPEDILEHDTSIWDLAYNDS